MDTADSSRKDESCLKQNLAKEPLSVKIKSFFQNPRENLL